MANYVYRCPDGHECIISHPMLQSVETYCPECGQRMWRRPQSFLVNWNGPAPSQGDVAPAIKEHLRDRPRNLARNVEKYGTE